MQDYFLNSGGNTDNIRPELTFQLGFFIKIKNCSLKDKSDLFQMCQVFNISIIDHGKYSLILESVHTESKNSEIIRLISTQIVVRGGSVAIGSISVFER